MHETPGPHGPEAPPQFSFGRVSATRGIQELVIEERIDLWALLERHVIGDWGDLDDEDKKSNDEALLNGRRLLSSYRIDAELTVWIITEAGRELTTVLIPSEY